MTRTGQRTAFVFAGGGSLGAIQVGMLRVLLSAGVQPDFVVGASVGAINAAYFAGAPSAEGVARLAEIWFGLRRTEVFPVTFKSAFGLLRHPDSVIDSGGLRHLIEINLAYARLEDATVPVHVTATDVEGMAVVLASAAIPGVFPPVRIGGQTLMDGAIARHSPIRVAADLGASRIVVLLTGYACSLKELPKGAIARVLHAITLLIEWRLIHDVERLADAIDVCIVPALCPLDVSPYDFSAARDLMQRAEESTRKWLDGGGLSRRSRPAELEAHHH
jgi:NTE family protein